MSSTVTPSFTGSISATLQGIDVRNYRAFGSSLLPMMGRSDRDTLFLSSSSGVERYDTSNRFFDDSRKFPTTRASYVSDDAYKIIAVPNFDLDESTLGVSTAFKSSPPYLDTGLLNAKDFIVEDLSYQYPVVLDHPNAIDPFDMNGVIEPLVIRDAATRSSLFLGSNIDPEPRSPKGGISGPYVASSYGKSYLISNFYEAGIQKKQNKLEAFKEHLGSDDEVLLYAKPVYTTDENNSNKAFSDSSDSEIRIDNLGDIDMKNVILSMSISGSDITCSSFSAKTTGCGFVYNNSAVGTDSIAFGGLLR